MERLIREIVVVGGGTSGWLSAVFLQRALHGEGHDHCRVTLVESSDIGTIGVGEATIPTIRRTFKFCGIDETEWMVRCNASFKLAIRFADWCGPGHVYWHPFGPLPSVGGLYLSHHWLQRRLRGNQEPFDRSCFCVIPSCLAKRAPKRPVDGPFEGPVPYAYHLDAGLLATYLKEVGTRRGVVHIVDDVLEVGLDERGYIHHLRTRDHGELGGDLFIDCTGFAGLLINQALGEPFVSFAEALLCDRAIAIPVPTEDTIERNPYTSATALGAGWVWDIPLYDRRGTGYVYSSAFVSPDDAEAELRAHLGPRSDPMEARHIRMRVGKTRNPWVRNCVAIGLSGGFIEPLESTGIFFIELGLFNLIMNFPDKRFNPALAKKYNRIMTQHYEQIRDFIVLHYCTTQREDTGFWRANKYHDALPDSLREDLELWAAMLPNHRKLLDRRFFDEYSYSAILTGMGVIPDRGLPLLDYGSSPAPEEAFAHVEEEGRRLRTSLPDHYEYLAGLRGDRAGAERMTICLAPS